jgi:DNA invertase Pin-like site-specific DNA recombinase
MSPLDQILVQRSFSRKKKQSDLASPSTGLCALYVRVSTADQGERYSPASQLKRLREKAARDGKAVRDDLVFTDHHSGKRADRPAFERMREAVKNRLVDVVYVYDVSRFARNVGDAISLEKEFKRVGVRLDFVEMPHEDSPTGRFTFTQMAAVAELMGEKIIADCTRGALQKLERGKLDHGVAPFGLKYDPARENFVADPEQVAHAQQIFSWRGIDQWPIAKIIRTLHERGIRSKEGTLWSCSTLYRMIKNPTYMGKHVRRGIIIPCEAIVSEELWQAAQFTNKTYACYTGRPSKDQYLVRGFAFCARPGCVDKQGHPRRLIVEYSRGLRYYHCGNVTYHPRERHCYASPITVSTLDDVVWSEVWTMLSDPALLEKIGNAYLKQQRPGEQEDRASILQQEMRKLAGKCERLAQMMEDGVGNYGDNLHKVRSCEARMREIEIELANSKRLVRMPPLRMIERYTERIRDNYPTEFKARRDILEGILDLRVMYYDRDLEITGRVPISVRSEKNYSDGSTHRTCGVGLDGDGRRRCDRCGTAAAERVGHRRGEYRLGRVLHGGRLWPGPAARARYPRIAGVRRGQDR